MLNIEWSQQQTDKKFYFYIYFYSFGSGFNIESTDPNYINEVKQIISYAKSKNIEVGGYDLIALTRKSTNPDYIAYTSDM